MYVKRVAGAAIAAGVGISVLTVGVEPANAAPLKPAPTWHGPFADEPGPGGPGGPGFGPGGPGGTGPGGPAGPAAAPFAPKGAFDRGGPMMGGPTNAPRGFSAPGHGAPPPPLQHGFGWNDGPAPGVPPRDW